ncbi:MAG: hypothetical protein IPJ33_04240 [Gammaproteobacteria bacterium]|nr:hypothetical protein [Gammaproteobacteria bacterium]
MGSYILGLATITKLPGILLIIPFALAHLRRSRSERGPFIRALINRNIIVAVTLFAVVFFLSNPGALIHFDDFVEMVLSLVWQRPEPTIEASSVAVNNSPLHFDFYFRAVQRPRLADTFHGNFGWCIRHSAPNVHFIDSACIWRLLFSLSYRFQPIDFLFTNAIFYPSFPS